MLAGLSAMTSLTGGGGLAPSSSATSSTGDQINDAAFTVGGISFGASNNGGINSRDLIIGGVAVVFALVALKAIKKR